MKFYPITYFQNTEDYFNQYQAVKTFSMEIDEKHTSKKRPRSSPVKRTSLTRQTVKRRKTQTPPCHSAVVKKNHLILSNNKSFDFPTTIDFVLQLRYNGQWSTRVAILERYGFGNSLVSIVTIWDAVTQNTVYQIRVERGDVTHLKQLRTGHLVLLELKKEAWIYSLDFTEELYNRYVYEIYDFKNGFVWCGWAHPDRWVETQQWQDNQFVQTSFEKFPSTIDDCVNVLITPVTEELIIRQHPVPRAKPNQCALIEWPSRNAFQIGDQKLNHAHVILLGDDKIVSFDDGVLYTPTGNRKLPVQWCTDFISLTNNRFLLVQNHNTCRVCLVTPKSISMLVDEEYYFRMIHAFERWDDCLVLCFNNMRKSNQTHVWDLRTMTCKKVYATFMADLFLPTDYTQLHQILMETTTLAHDLVRMVVQYVM